MFQRRRSLSTRYHSGPLSIYFWLESDTYAPFGLVQNTNLPLDPPTTIGSHEKILRRLVSRNFLQDELCSLLGTVFSSKESTNTVLCLPGDDAQVVIDILDEVRRRSANS